MLFIAFVATTFAIDVAVDTKEAAVLSEGKVSVEVSANAEIKTDAAPPAATTTAPTTAAPTTAAPTTAAPEAKDAENREVSAGSGFQVESQTSQFMSNLGTVRDLIKQAKELSGDSERWPGLTGELQAIASMADQYIASQEGGVVFKQKFLSGFQSAEVIFPLLKFKATHELDTVPITSIVRTQELEMAFDDVLDYVADVGAQSEAMEEASIALTEETTRVRDLDFGESWMKKKDVKGLARIYNDFLAKAARDQIIVVTLSGELMDLNDTMTEAINQMYGTLHWDAVVGLSLSLNISMDLSNNFAKATSDLPEDIIAAGKKMEFGKFANDLYTAVDGAAFKKVAEAMLASCTPFNEALEKKLGELKEKKDDEAATKSAAAIDNVKGDLAELTDELEELVAKVSEGDQVTTGEAAEWLLGEMEAALSLDPNDILDDRQGDDY